MTTKILTILMIIPTISYGNADTPYEMVDNHLWLFNNPDDFSDSPYLFWHSLMKILTIPNGNSDNIYGCFLKGL